MRRNEPFEERPFDVDERAKNLIQDLAGMGGMSVEGLFYLVSINEIDLAVSELGWGLYNRQVKISSEHAAEFFVLLGGSDLLPTDFSSVVTRN